METPRLPYHMAAKFTNPDRAKQVYMELESRLKALRFDAHVSRLMIAKEMYVSFISERPEGSIPAPVLEEVRRILASRGGQLTTLPADAIANIQARRQARRAQGIGQFESHEPTQSTYRYPVLQDHETKEVLAEYPDQGEFVGERPYTGPMPGSVDSSPVPAKPSGARIKSFVSAPVPQGRQSAPGKAAKPLIERYLTYLRVAMEQAHARLHDKRVSLDQYNFQLLLMSSYHETYSRLAGKAKKYRLAASAQNMIEALRPRPLLQAEMSLEVMADIGTHRRELDPDIATPILTIPASPIWLELEEPVQAANGEIAGVFFTCSDREIDQMLADERRPAMRKVLEASALRPGQFYRWAMHFIAIDGTPTTSYQYEEDACTWSIVPAADGHQICPTGECEERPREGGSFDIVPCAFCAVVAAYWRSWLVTALLMVQGDLAATEVGEWSRHQEQALRKVKRERSGKYDEIKVMHEYYLVAFDASVTRVKAEQPELEPERESTLRGSWVAAAQEVDPASVVYVRYDFGQSQRRLDPEKNPRWKEKRTVAVKSYSKRVPMRVDRMQHKITRVIASRFEQKERT